VCHFGFLLRSNYGIIAFVFIDFYGCFFFFYVYFIFFIDFYGFFIFSAFNFYYLMDKTNRNIANTSTNTAHAQQQQANRTATAPSAATALAQQAPSLGSAVGSNPRTVQDASNKRLDVACNILNQLFAKIDTETSAISRIIELLNRKDPKTQETLSCQLILSNHTNGLAFVEKCTSKLKDLLKKASQAIIIDDCGKKYILDVLGFPIDGQSLFTLAYKNNWQEDIKVIEGIIYNFLNLLDKRPEGPIGLFELAQVINESSLAPMLGYFIRYPLQFTEDLSCERKDRVIQQYALYFLYAFLSKDSGLLRFLKHTCNELNERFCDTYQQKACQQIASVFWKILSDLQHTDLEKHGIKHTDYEPLILEACRAFPYLLNQEFRELSKYATFRPSVNFLKAMIALETADKQCFLDLMYKKICDAKGEVLGYLLDRFSSIEDFLVDSKHFTLVSPVLLNLALPHLIQYLSKVSMETIAGYNRNAERKQFQYLILSILSKDINCIERFKDAPITSPEQAQLVSMSLIQLMKHLLGMNILEDSLTQEVLLGQTEFFFKILDTLKGLNPLKQLDLTTNILSLCLNKDFEADMAGTATPTFDSMLEGLQKIGFDLDYIDPETGLNILAEAYELEMDTGTLRLFTKLLNLGCNPFLIPKKGPSVYRQIANNPIYRDLYARHILDHFKLATHPFLSPGFINNVLRNNRLDERDEQGRTPLMLYVMMNVDIKGFFGKNLEKLEAKHLEAEDNKGWTVLDYAEHNRDLSTLALLNARKKALEKKAKKSSGFKQAAVLVSKLATPKAPSVEASKTPVAPSASSKRRQARKLRAKEGASPASQASDQEITIDYNPATGTSTISMAEVRREAAEASKKKEAKAAAKQNKKEDQKNTVQHTDKKEGLFAKAKKKIKAVSATLETVKNLATHPQAFVQTLASKLGQAKAGERLAQGQKVYNIGKAQSLSRIEDGLWLNNSATLTDLASEAIGKDKLEMLPAVMKTLEAIDEAIKTNPRAKIDRHKILEALQWIVGGKIEYGKGSHLNLRYAGGVFTIPQNKDGSDNADIVYIKKVAGLMTQQLRGLLLGYEASEATLFSMDSSGSDEWNLHDNSATSSNEDVKDETPEASESEASNN
jgi:hypothetical protein